MTNRKIEALQEAAAQKARESASRVEKALEKIIKQGQIISFKSVAQAEECIHSLLVQTV